MDFANYNVKATVDSGIAGKKKENREMIISYKVKSSGKNVRTGNLIYLMSGPGETEPEAGLVKDIIIAQSFIKASQAGKKSFMDPDKVIKEKTLVINTADLKNRTEEDVKKAYPYPYKVATPQEFSKLILEKNPDHVFFDYTESDDMPTVLVYSIANEIIHWRMQAKGVNNYVHVNFEVLAGKLKK
jgi:hypothetical protein